MEEPILNLAECDVVVIGGGSTGIICAASLASQGIKTVLAEPRGSLWWETTWARQRVVLESTRLPIVNAFREELIAAGGIRNGIVEPVIAQLMADKFCIQKGVKVLFHARPIDLEWQESGKISVKMALKGQMGILSARGCVDCSDNGLLTRAETNQIQSQPVKFAFWCLTFSNCTISKTKEAVLFLGNNEMFIRLRPGCWNDEVVVDIAYPASCFGSYPVELAFTSDLEPLVVELRRIVPELKEGILAHVSDVPWSLPAVIVAENQERLFVHGEQAKFIGAGYWLEGAWVKINETTFWEQSNYAVNLAMELGEIAAQEMVKNLLVEPGQSLL